MYEQLRQAIRNSLGVELVTYVRETTDDLVYEIRLRGQIISRNYYNRTLLGNSASALYIEREQEAKLNNLIDRMLDRIDWTTFFDPMREK